MPVKMLAITNCSMPEGATLVMISPNVAPFELVIVLIGKS